MFGIVSSIQADYKEQSADGYGKDRLTILCKKKNVSGEKEVGGCKEGKGGKKLGKRGKGKMQHERQQSEKSHQNMHMKESCTI